MSVSLGMALGRRRQSRADTNASVNFSPSVTNLLVPSAPIDAPRAVLDALKAESAATNEQKLAYLREALGWAATRRVVQVVVQEASHLLPKSELPAFLSDGLCLMVNAEHSMQLRSLADGAAAPYQRVVEELLRHRADASSRDMGKHSALMVACEAGEVGVVRLLLSTAEGRRLDTLVNQVTVPEGQPHGDTALRLAARVQPLASARRIARLLIDAGARLEDAPHQSFLARNVLDDADKAGNRDLFPLLLMASAWHRCPSGDVSDAGLEVRRTCVELDPTGQFGVRNSIMREVFGMEMEELVARFVTGFRASPTDGFSDAVFLAAAFTDEARAMKIKDRFYSDLQLIQATRVQLLACAVLRAMDRGSLPSAPNSLVDDVLSSEQGLRTVALAVKKECKVLLAHPELQMWLKKRWRGELRIREMAALTPFNACMHLGLSLGCMFYPPLLETWNTSKLAQHVRPPSPRLRFRLHMVSDLLFGICLAAVPQLGMQADQGGLSDVATTSILMVWALAGGLLQIRRLVLQLYSFRESDGQEVLPGASQLTEPTEANPQMSTGPGAANSISRGSQSFPVATQSRRSSRSSNQVCDSAKDVEARVEAQVASRVDSHSAKVAKEAEGTQPLTGQKARKASGAASSFMSKLPSPALTRRMSAEVGVNIGRKKGSGTGFSKPTSAKSDDGDFSDLRHTDSHHTDSADAENSILEVSKMPKDGSQKVACLSQGACRSEARLMMCWRIPAWLRPALCPSLQGREKSHQRRPSAPTLASKGSFTMMPLGPTSTIARRNSPDPDLNHSERSHKAAPWFIGLAKTRRPAALARLRRPAFIRVPLVHSGEQEHEQEHASSELHGRVKKEPAQVVY